MTDTAPEALAADTVAADTAASDVVIVAVDGPAGSGNLGSDACHLQTSYFFCS